MDQRETSANNLTLDIISLYQESEYNFLKINSQIMGSETIKIEWLFENSLNSNDIVSFFLYVTEEDTIPSISHIIPSANEWQMLIYDNYGIKIDY